MTIEAIGNQVLAGHVVRDGLTTIRWRCLMVRQSRPRLREITENRDDDSHLRTQGWTIGMCSRCQANGLTTGHCLQLHMRHGEICGPCRQELIEAGQW